MIPRPLLRALHAIAGAGAMVTLVVFLGATLASEIAGDAALVARAKSAIVSGLPLLILLLAAVGASGFRLAGPSPKGLAAHKLGRMRIVAANGILVLVPAALFLNWKAGQGSFDGPFYLVQIIEIAFGLCNLTLLGLNMNDGIKMATGRRNRIAAAGGASPARQQAPQGTTAQSSVPLRMTDAIEK